MKTPNQEVKMVAGNGNETELAKETPKAKQVKIKAIYPIRLADGTVVQPQQVATVSESEAKLFCDDEFEGVYPFSGFRDTVEVSTGKLRRAVRA